MGDSAVKLLRQNAVEARATAEIAEGRANYHKSVADDARAYALERAEFAVECDQAADRLEGK